MEASEAPVAPATPALDPPKLELRGVSKTFPGQMALVDADLELRRGEVHALLGQNGSGKSTLIKVLAGFHAADPGAEARLDGVAFELGAAHDELRFVHQDLALVPELDAVDNLALGASYSARWWLSDRRERTKAREVLDEFGIDIDVHEPLSRLAPAERTMLAIARALRDSSRGTVLVLDEPTASLGGEEAAQLHGLVRRLRDEGGTVLYVTHRLEEVFAFADRVTVLRDGRRVATEEVTRLDHDRLVELIVGRPLQEVYPEPATARDDLAYAGSRLRGEVVDDVSFELFAGELLGITGLVGSGREELPYLVAGARPLAAGELRLGDRLLPPLTPRRAIAEGLGFVASDRKNESALPLLSVAENVTLPRLDISRRLRWLSERRERTRAMEWLERLDIRPASPDAPLTSLSGGNQQKAVIARWFRYGSHVLVLDEPTQGVDVGAKAGIYEQLIAFAAAGNAALVFSSDAEELAALCDRVLVLRDGRVADTLHGDALTTENLGELLLRAPRTTHTETSR